jgi:hypothetical protein
LFKGLTDEWVYFTFSMKFLLACQLAANWNKLLLALSVGLSLSILTKRESGASQLISWKSKLRFFLQGSKAYPPANSSPKSM